MIFLDTSVLIAVAHVHHMHHAPSLDLWNRCARADTVVSAHTLAEVYNVLTAMPRGYRLSPRAAADAVDVFLARVTPVELSAEEYVAAIRAASALGVAGGSIYDALHVACARKVNADFIYSWNLRDFERVAPDLAGRIARP